MTDHFNASIKPSFKSSFNTSLFISCLLLGQTGFAQPATDRQNELLYFLKHDCGSCHGMTMKGGLGPALLPQTLAGKADSYLVATIMHGREGTAMPGWSSMLTQQEARWLVTRLKNAGLEQNELATGKP